MKVDQQIMKKVFMTGIAGFVGTNMVKALQKKYPGIEIQGFDNFSTGKIENMLSTPDGSVKYYAGDITDHPHNIPELMKGSDMVFHFAANADIRDGINRRSKDLYQNIEATQFILEAMKESGVKKILFTSSAVVYGQHNQIPTPEDASMPVQNSLYAASKLAAEGYITSYCNYFGWQSLIFRPVSMLGPHYSHGHVIDFYNQLKIHPDCLEILGNGKARKSYIHVTDACDAMLHVAECLKHWRSEIYNLGLPEYINVESSAAIIAQEMGVEPLLAFTSNDASGWAGDVPFVYLDVNKLLKTTWEPGFNLRNSIRDTVKWLIKNESITVPSALDSKPVPPNSPTLQD